MRERSGNAVVAGLIVLVLAVAACSGSAGSASVGPSASAAAAVASSGAVSTAPPASSAAASTPAASAAPASPGATPFVWPSGVPELDPTYCPPTLPPGVHATADGMQIDGDQAFIDHVGSALDLVKRKAPDLYADVLANMVMIRQVDSVSGMCFNTGSYRVGDETAHPPGYAKAQAVIWLAGTIVHDNCHRTRFVEGLPPSGRDAELACLKIQMQALKQIDPTPGFAAYIKSLIDGVDDPANQYWTNPNRHW
jgi:hypothetical protein